MNEVLPKDRERFEREIAPTLIEAIEYDGVYVWERAISGELADRLRERALAQESEFKRARVGSAGDAQSNSEIRRDQTKWWELDTLDEGERDAFAVFTLVKDLCNREFYLGLDSFEGHYAIYEPGAFYRTHLDRFRKDDARTLSMVLFLNPDWKPEDGGALRLKDRAGAERTVWPESGTLVIFMSADIPHEVCETHRKRFSVAGWWKRRA